jgi:hypothetical protein
MKRSSDRQRTWCPRVRKISSCSSAAMSAAASKCCGLHLTASETLGIEVSVSTSQSDFQSSWRFSMALVTLWSQVDCYPAVVLLCTVLRRHGQQTVRHFRGGYSKLKQPRGPPGCVAWRRVTGLAKAGGVYRRAFCDGSKWGLRSCENTAGSFVVVCCSS